MLPIECKKAIVFGFRQNLLILSNLKTSDDLIYSFLVIFIFLIRIRRLFTRQIVNINENTKIKWISYVNSWIDVHKNGVISQLNTIEKRKITIYVTKVLFV